MGKRRPVVLDSGALIALERGNPFMRELLRQVIATGGRFLIPAGVIAQIWRNGSKQAVIAALLKRPEVTVVPLDEAFAKSAGIICGRAGTDDVIDASVVIVARLHSASIVTSDPVDLSQLDNQVVLHSV